MVVCSNTCYIPHAKKPRVTTRNITFVTLEAYPLLLALFPPNILHCGVRPCNNHAFATLAARMAHHFRTTHNPAPPGGMPRPTPPAQSYHYAQPHSYAPSGTSSRKVRFEDDYRPSALQLKISLGPKDRPTCEVKISVHFEEGRLPRIKVKTKRPREHTHRKRRRSYVDEQDGERRW